MADILIRGMEMPKDGRITIQIGADGAVYFVENCRIMAEKYEKSSHAVPLAEGHGRLGDLDALYEVAKTRSMGIYGPCNAQCVITGNDILKAPTIVPAEGGKNE